MDNIINKYLPLIKSIANTFYGIDYDDLIQSGIIGLINAYKNYKRSENTKFSSYAYQYIYGEMYNYTLKNKSIKQQKDNLKIVKLYEQTKNYLTQSLGKIPSKKEISSYLKINEEIIDNALINTYEILSIDNDTTLNNTIGITLDMDLKIDLDNSINMLSDEEKQIIKYRYFKDLTQSEVSKKLGISQVKVSRYEKRSLSKLQNYLCYE